MVISVVYAVEYLNSHKLHYTCLIVCTARTAILFLSKVKVDKHTLKAVGLLRTYYDDIVRQNIAI